MSGCGCDCGGAGRDGGGGFDSYDYGGTARVKTPREPWTGEEIEGLAIAVVLLALVVAGVVAFLIYGGGTADVLALYHMVFYRPGV